MDKSVIVKTCKYVVISVCKINYNVLHLPLKYCDSLQSLSELLTPFTNCLPRNTFIIMLYSHSLQIIQCNKVNKN